MSNIPKLASVELADLELGPAMAACNERQRKAAFGYVLLGMSKTDAIRAAGYDETHTQRIFQTPKVQAALEELSRALLKEHAATAVRVLLDLMHDVTVPPDTRRKAATDILNRSGIPIATEHTLNVVHHEMSTTEKKSRLIALADELGLDDKARERLLLPPSKILDAEFEPVEQTPEPVAAEVSDEDKRWWAESFGDGNE